MEPEVNLFLPGPNEDTSSLLFPACLLQGTAYAKGHDASGLPVCVRNRDLPQISLCLAGCPDEAAAAAAAARARSRVELLAHVAGHPHAVFLRDAVEDVPRGILQLVFRDDGGMSGAELVRRCGEFFLLGGQGVMG